MNKPKIKLIALDVDGTLINSERYVSQENIAALKEAEAKGVKLAICSGRICEDASWLADDMGFDDFYILALNGAHCLESPHGKTYETHFMPNNELMQCIDLLNAEDAIYTCFSLDHLCVSRDPYNSKELEYWSPFFDRKGKIYYKYGKQEILNRVGIGINKLAYVEFEDLDRLNHLRSIVEKIPNLEIVSSWNNNFEIMPKNVNKGTALSGLTKKLNLTADEVMAIGDNENDLSMLKFANFSVAMENGSDSAKKAARFTTLSNNNSGVAHAIRKYVLN